MLLGARPFLALTVTLSTAFAFSLAAVLSTTELASLERTIIDDRIAGSSVFVVTDSQRQVDPDQCVRMSTWVGVAMSGWMLEADPIEFSQSPRNPFRYVMISSSMPELMTGGARATYPEGILLGRAAAEELGLVTGSTTVTQRGTVDIAGVLDLSSRVPEQARWVYELRAEPPTRASQCWVEAEPGYVDALRVAILAGFHGSDSIEVAALHRGDAANAAGRWHNRPTRYAWAASGIFAALLQSLSLVSIRGEFALYRLFRVAIPQVTALYSIAFTCLSLGGALIAGALAWGSGIVLLEDWASTALWYSLAGLAGAFAISTSLTVAAALIVSSRRIAPSLRG